MPPEENDKNKQELVEDELASMADDFSYLDYLIQQKFFKRYSWYLRGTIAIFGLVIGGLAWFGIPTYVDLQNKLNESNRMYGEIQTVYEDYLERDSIQSIMDENSEYYAYFCYRDDEINRLREAVVKEIIETGFGYVAAESENSINKYLYASRHKEDNEAARHIEGLKTTQADDWCIAVVYNAVPDTIRQRFDTVFENVYPDIDIEYFKDTSIPRKGILYYIYTGPY